MVVTILKASVIATCTTIKVIGDFHNNFILLQLYMYQKSLPFLFKFCNPVRFMVRFFHLGKSQSGFLIQDHLDHGVSKEPTNSLWVRIRWFL